MNKSEIAEQIVEYVRRNHNSRSDKLMELIAAYDEERAIAESQARPFSDETIAEHVTTEILLKLPCHHLWKRVTHAFRQVIHSKIMEGLKLPRLGDGEPSRRQTAREWMLQTGEHATELHSLVGEEVYAQILADMDEFAESGAAQEVSPPSPRFPIINGPSIPWEVIEPHERQAQSNHDQTLRRLAERGGLSPAEAWFVLNDMSWDVSTDWKKADEDGKALLNSINLRYERNGEGDTRELKAALRESAYLMSDKGFDELDVEEWDHRAKAIRDLAELLG
jgi:hypothetical protein